MSETDAKEPSQRRGGLVVLKGGAVATGEAGAANEIKRWPSETTVSFDRHELRVLFDLYGAKVAAGEWRDYALDFTPAMAVFSVFRRASEAPLYRIEKIPALARRQGVYAVVAAGGLVLRRGQDLARVLRVLDRKLQLVGAE